jgi:hypothetical protein
MSYNSLASLFRATTTATGQHTCSSTAVHHSVYYAKNLSCWVISNLKPPPLPPSIPPFVYILTPIIEATKQASDLSNQPIPLDHFLTVNCFIIPAKKNTGSSPVVVKLHSEAIHSVVIKYKKTVLPPCLEPSFNQIQNMYSIFEDLAPTIHTQLRALIDNICVHSVWP